MLTAISVCPANRPQLPAVLTGPLDRVLPTVADLGFDGVELHLRSADEVPRYVLIKLLSASNLGVSALCTGRGLSEDGLSLSDPSPEGRQAALVRLLSQAELAAELGTPVVVAAMRGNRSQETLASEQRRWLLDSVANCAARAEVLGTGVLLEPQRQPDLDNLSTLEEVLQFIHDLGDPPGIKVMLDGMHLESEGLSLPEGILKLGHLLGYLQLCGPDRRPPTLDAVEVAAIAATCRSAGYDGYIGVECLPLPDPITAARHAFSLASSVALA